MGQADRLRHPAVFQLMYSSFIYSLSIVGCSRAVIDAVLDSCTAALDFTCAQHTSKCDVTILKLLWQSCYASF